MCAIWIWDGRTSGHEERWRVRVRIGHVKCGPWLNHVRDRRVYESCPDAQIDVVIDGDQIGLWQVARW